MAQESKMYANGADDQRDEKDEQKASAPAAANAVPAEPRKPKTGGVEIFADDFEDDEV